MSSQRTKKFLSWIRLKLGITKEQEKMRFLLKLFVRNSIRAHVWLISMSGVNFTVFYSFKGQICYMTANWTNHMQGNCQSFIYDQIKIPNVFTKTDKVSNFGIFQVSGANRLRRNARVVHCDLTSQLSVIAMGSFFYHRIHWFKRLFAWNSNDHDKGHALKRFSRNHAFDLFLLWTLPSKRYSNCYRAHPITL